MTPLQLDLTRSGLMVVTGGQVANPDSPLWGNRIALVSPATQMATPRLAFLVRL